MGGSGFIFDYHATSAAWIAKCQLLRLEHRNVALRSLCNGWPTSYRYHEPILLPCVFGCHLNHPRPDGASPVDTMVHYLACPQLWRIVYSITSIQSNGPAVRLGVGSSGGLLPIVLAHHIYNFVRRTHRDLVLSMHNRSEMNRLLESAFRFGIVAWADL